MTLKKISLVGWLTISLVLFPLFGLRASILKGDFNGDDVVNSLDITDFKIALGDKISWEGSTGRDADKLGDFNYDGTFNSLDITGFKTTLSTGYPPAPATAYRRDSGPLDGDNWSPTSSGEIELNMPFDPLVTTLYMKEFSPATFDGTGNKSTDGIMAARQLLLYPGMQIDLSDGTINLAEHLYVGSTGGSSPVTFNQTGGTLTVGTGYLPRDTVRPPGHIHTHQRTHRR